MPTHCNAPRCTNSSNGGYGFKAIPTEGTIRTLWLSASGCLDWNPPAGARLCEVHFDPTMVFFVGRRKSIKSDAVPIAFCSCPIPPETTRRIRKGKTLEELRDFTRNNSDLGLLEHSYSSGVAKISSKKKRHAVGPDQLLSRPPGQTNRVVAEHNYVWLTTENSCTSRKRQRNQSHDLLPRSDPKALSKEHCYAFPEPVAIKNDENCPPKKRCYKFNHASDCIVKKTPISIAVLPTPPQSSSPLSPQPSHSPQPSSLSPQSSPPPQSSPLPQSPLSPQPSPLLPQTPRPLPQSLPPPTDTLQGRLPQSLSSSLVDTPRPPVKRRGRGPPTDPSVIIERLKKQVTEQESVITSLRQEKIRLVEEIQTKTYVMDKALGNDQQKAILTGRTRGSPWSDETIKKGLHLRLMCGTTGYESLIQSGIPYPSVRTLQEKIKHVDFNPGVLHEIFDYMEVVVPTLKDQDRRCALVFDEMAIKSKIDFDRSTGGYIGQVTFKGAEGEAATKALAVQLVGLAKRWKQYVGYHFTPSRCFNEAVKDFILEILQRSFLVGLKVLVLICDMGNRGLLSSLGFNTTKNNMIFVIPNPFTVEEPLFMLPDPVHVFKNVKMMCIEHRFIKLPADVVDLYELPTDTADFAYCDWLDKYQEEHCKELKYAPKLNATDIHPTHFRKMKVTSTTNVLNDGTAAAMYQLVIEGELPDEARTTAWLIKLLAAWFKLMTSRNLTLALSPHKTEKYEEAIGLLRLASDVFRRMVVGDGSWRTAQTLFIICTESMLALQERLLNKEGFQFFKTGNANQDNIESGFSNIRRGQPKPSALDFKFRLRQLCLVGQDTKIANSSYDTSESVPSLLDLLLSKRTSRDAEEPDNLSGVVLPTLAETNDLNRNLQFLVYRIAGYTVHQLRKSIKCGACLKQLQAPEGCCHPLSQFVDLTDYSPGAQIRASPELCDLFSAVERIMWAAKDDLIRMGDRLRDKFTAHLRGVLTGFSLGTCHPIENLLIGRYVKMRLPQLTKNLSKDRAPNVHGDAALGSRTMGGGLLTERFVPRAGETLRTSR